jgi:hypothetical protein
MPIVIDPTWECEVLDGSGSTLQPRKQAGPSIRHQLELHRSPRLLLDNDCSRADVRTYDQITDLDLYKVAALEFAVDRKIEESSVSKPSLAVKEEPDRPYLSGLQSTLFSDFPAGISCPMLVRHWIILRVSHRFSPAATIGQKNNGWNGGRSAFACKSIDQKVL